MKTKKISDKKLSLRKCFLYIPVDKNTIQVRGPEKLFVMQGKNISDIFFKLYPKLDGTRTIDELLTDLKVSKYDALDIVTKMYEKNFLEEITPHTLLEFSPSEKILYDRQINFFSIFTDKKFDFQHMLKKSRVAIFDLGRVGSQVLLSLAISGVGKLIGIDHRNVGKSDIDTFYLKEDIGMKRCDVAYKVCKRVNSNIQFNGISKKITSANEITDCLGDVDLAILCQDGPSILEYQWMNEACLKREIPWMSARLEGYIGTIGPSIIPYQTACYTCYELQMKANLLYYDEYLMFEKFLIRKRIEENEKNYGEMNFFPIVLGNHLAMEAIKSLLNFPTTSPYGKIYLFNFFTHETSSHEVLKLPTCPSCGVKRPYHV